VSRDAEPSHKAFMQKYTLPFPLVADASGAVTKAYHVPSTLGFDKRVSFLVGPDGKIVKVYPDVDPGVHAKEMLDAIGALKAAHK
jgi:peroxiredoxin Q/BCP